jgi:hypothetical protein
VHRERVAGEVDPVVDQELGQVVGVLVLPGVVEGLCRGLQRDDRVDVVGVQRPGGEPVGKVEQLGHESTG